MKPGTLSFALTLTLAAVLGAANAGPVLDTDGNPLLPGVGYYVMPYTRFWPAPGGLRLAGRGSKLCPLDVVLSRLEVDNGYPVKFSNWSIEVPYVPESQDLNIEVVGVVTICIQRTFWWLDHFDTERKNWFVTTGHEPGPSRSFFKIEKSKTSSEHIYKFVFYDLNVGRFEDEKGIQRLALSDEPYYVMFVKAGGTKQGSTMIM